MEIIVRSLIIYNLSGSAVVFGFIGGVLADRRSLLIASQLVHGGSPATLGLLVLTDSIRIYGISSSQP